MRTHQNFLLLGLCAGIAACSGAPGDAAAPAAKPAATASAAARVGAGTVCDRKLLDVSRLDGILDESISGTKPLRGDAQTCYFITATNESGGPEIMVSLRPGMGRATIASFTSGHMNDYADWKPLSGVGDGGVWMPALHEVQAQKDDVLCDASAHGLSKALANAGESAQLQRLGGVCNDVFVALKLMPAVAAQAVIKPAAGGNVLDPACDHALQPADVAGIISAAVERQPGYGPQSCTYRAKGYPASVTISLADGDSGKMTWDALTNPATVKMDALPGVGEAAQQGRGGTLVVARKGTLVCSVDVSGTDNGPATQVMTKDRGIALATKLGALCGKVFAAR
ncbi:MAG: hypothetical protein ABI846_09780 [Rudaea sp.]